MTVQLERVLYTASAVSTGGRDGQVRTRDSAISLRVAPPRKRVEGATNPEELFAAGYASCFASALAEVAAARRVDVSQAEVTCEVDLGTTRTEAGYGLAVRIGLHLPGADEELVSTLVTQAHAVCPYSQALRGNVAVTAAAQPRRGSSPEAAGSG